MSPKDTVERPTELRDAAIGLAEVGAYVFPLDGKKALTHKGFNGRNWGASNDPKVAAARWAKWPNANIGLATGLPIPGSSERWTLCVIDIDGPDGKKSWDKFVKGRPLPDTRRVTTGREGGGTHLYFGVPPGVSVKTCTWMDGVDVRGRGGMVVLPPSRHSSGRTYEWQGGVIEPAPEWLINALPQVVPIAQLTDEQVRMVHAEAGAGSSPMMLDLIEGKDYAVEWSETDIEGALGVLDPDMDYHEWVKMGMLLHEHYSGGETGLDLWDRWSSTGSKYKPGECRKKWRTFQEGRADSVGLGSLIHQAREAGFEGGPQNGGGSGGPGGGVPSAGSPPDRPRSTLNEREALELMNGRHAFLMRQGGKALVLNWQVDDSGFRRPVLQSVTDFKAGYCNIKVRVAVEGERPRYKQLGTWWIEHPQRRTYAALTFDPSEGPVVGTGHNAQLNLWTGFAVEPVAGDWSLMKGHVLNVIAGGDKDVYDYIIQWVAWGLQNPGLPAEVALVLKGGEGTGKGSFARAVCSLYGAHGLHATSLDRLTGRFNDHLMECAMMLADEIHVTGNKQAEGTLKGIITEPTMMIEGKGLKPIQARNRVKVMILSNEEQVVPAGPDARRYMVVEVNERQQGDKAYFTDLRNQMEQGGSAAMLHELLSMDLKGWHPRYNVVRTAALDKQKELSLPPGEQFILDILESGELPVKPIADGTAEMLFGDIKVEIFVGGHARREIQEGLGSAMRKSVPALKGWSDNRLGRILTDWKAGKALVKNNRTRTLKPLAEMREMWNAKYGTREWNDQTDWCFPDDAADDSDQAGGKPSQSSKDDDLPY